MASGAESASHWCAGDVVEREIDDGVWVTAVVVSACSAGVIVDYPDGNREDGVDAEELRRPTAPGDPEPEAEQADSAAVTSGSSSAEATGATGAAEPDAACSDDDDGGGGEPQSASDSLEARVARRQRLERWQQHGGDKGTAGSDESARVLARSRSLLAGGSALCSRIDSALHSMSRDALGSSAMVEADWQAYRSQHDVLGDRLVAFGRSFPAGTWEAAASTAGNVMAGLMEGVELPTPSLVMAPTNTAQLLSEALQQEKRKLQQLWVQQYRREQAEAAEAIEERSAAAAIGTGTGTGTGTATTAGDQEESRSCRATVAPAPCTASSLVPPSWVHCGCGRTSCCVWEEVGTAAAAARLSSSAGSHSHRRQDDHSDHDHAWSWCREIENACPAVGVGGLIEQQQRRRWGQQPFFGSLLEEFVVGEGDPRLGLVGQRAVRVMAHAPAPARHVVGSAATEPEPEPELEEMPPVSSSSSSVAGRGSGQASVAAIPAGSVLLHYAGSVRTQSEFDERYDLQQSLLNGYVFLLRDKKTNRKPKPKGEGEDEAEDEDEAEGGGGGGEALLLDAYDGGNSACMINDYRLNPFNDPQTHQALLRALRAAPAAEAKPAPADTTDSTATTDAAAAAVTTEARAMAEGCGGPGPVPIANVCFRKVWDRGWPHLFIVALVDLKVGEELLLDYGEAYWESRRQACLGANQTVPLPLNQ
eukprot:COSAG06_NODE_751_length_12582_cov_40.259072_4_plen_704_part_00